MLLKSVLLVTLLAVIGAASGEKKHVMFVVPPAHSHFHLLHELAIGFGEEFGEAYRISFVTHGKYVTLAQASGLFETYDVSAPEPVAMSSPEHGDALIDCREMKDPRLIPIIESEDTVKRLAGAALVANWTWACQYDGLAALFADERTRPDFLVLDFFEDPARALAERYNVPSAAVATLGFAGWESRLWMAMEGPQAAMHGLWGRLANLRLLFQFISVVGKIVDGCNQPRLARGFGPAQQLSDYFSERLTIVPEPWLFHRARPVNPNALVVGFLVAPADSPRAALLTDAQRDAAVMRWLDEQQQRRVVLVAFGSIANVDSDLLNTLVAGLLAADDQLVVLLGLRDDNTAAQLDPVLAASPRLRRESWLPQRRVLAHPNLALFVTHGGITSIAEAVHSDVPLIVVPFFAEQPRNAWYISDAGVGVVLPRRGTTVAQVTDAARTVFANYSHYQANTRRMHAVSDYLGGRKSAARAIDAQIRLGFDYLRNIESEFSVVERYFLDLLAIVAVAFFAVCALVVAVCRRLCCARKVKSD